MKILFESFGLTGDLICSLASQSCNFQEILHHDMGGNRIVAVNQSFGFVALTLQIAPVCKLNSQTKLAILERGTLS